MSKTRQSRLASKTKTPMRKKALLMIAGRLELEDGTPPPESLRVELACNGQITRQVYSNQNGSFRFDLASRAETISDPSVSEQSTLQMMAGANPRAPGGSGMGNNSVLEQRVFGRFDFNGCEVRMAALPGFSADVINLGTRGELDSPDIGTIVIKRLKGVAGTTVSLKTLSAPRDSVEYYEQAKRILAKKKPDYSKAGKALRKATKLYPEFASAWYLLGRVRLLTNDGKGARKAFSQAIKSDHSFINPYLALTRMELQDERWSEAAALADKIVELNPELAEGQYFQGMANYYQGDLVKARQAFSLLDSRGQIESFPLAILHLGIVHSAQGAIAAAVSEFKRYLRVMPEDQVPEWHRERIAAQLKQWKVQGLIDADVNLSDSRP